jgi:hypothetical protein
MVALELDAGRAMVQAADLVLATDAAGGWTAVHTGRATT